MDKRAHLNRISHQATMATKCSSLIFPIINMTVLEITWQTPTFKTHQDQTTNISIHHKSLNSNFNIRIRFIQFPIETRCKGQYTINDMNQRTFQKLTSL